MTTLSPSPLSNSTLPPSTTDPATTNKTNTTDTFTYPPHHSFPPFYTLQPNLTTQTRQLTLWSSLLQSWSSHTRTFRLHLPSSLSHPPFHNPKISRGLDIPTLRAILTHMASAEGGNRVSWTPAPPFAGSTAATGAIPEAEKNTAWFWWKTPEEWGDEVYAWVEATGQKGVVLTVYELREGDATKDQLWVGMEEQMFRRCVDGLVRRGKAQVFGQMDGAGVKFF